MTHTVTSVADDVQAFHLSAQHNGLQSTIYEKAAKKVDRSSPISVETGNVESPEPGKPRRKPSFYLAVFSLMLVILIVSLDATALSVAIPVSWMY